MQLLRSKPRYSGSAAAVHFLTPITGFFVQEVLSDAGGTTSEDQFTVFALHLITVLLLQHNHMVPFWSLLFHFL